VTVVIRGCGQAKWVWYALVVRLAVPGEREHRLQQALEAQGWPHLTYTPGLAFAGVPKRVCGAGLHDDGLTCGGDQSPAAKSSGSWDTSAITVSPSYRPPFAGSSPSLR
jgi:hypothetical protein